MKIKYKNCGAREVASFFVKEVKVFHTLKASLCALGGENLGSCPLWFTVMSQGKIGSPSA